MTATSGHNNTSKFHNVESHSSHKKRPSADHQQDINMMDNSQTSTDSSPLANFLLKLNVAQSAVIVVDNVRPTALDRELIVASSTKFQEEPQRECQIEPQDTVARPDIDVPIGKKLKRRVSFDCKVRVVKCSPLANTDDLFYTKKEYKNMKKDIKATLTRHTQKEEKSSSDDYESVHCMRGLEAYFGDAKTAKHRARLHACLVVLTEQNRQCMENGNVIPLDEQELSRRYQHVSFKCQREAMRRGMEDYVIVFPAFLKCNKSKKQTSGYDIVGAPTSIRRKFRAVSSYAA